MLFLLQIVLYIIYLTYLLEPPLKVYLCEVWNSPQQDQIHLFNQYKSKPGGNSGR